jgi:hypothetical protein
MRTEITLSVYTTPLSLLTNYIHETRDHYLSIQHHGLFSPIAYMRTGTTLSVYTTPWSLITNPIHENRDHCICLCNTMVSSHQSHTWEQGPLYLSIQPHSLFSPTLFMTPWTTLSVYITSWSLLTNPIHENRDHYVYTTPWSLLTNSIHETRNHSICLYNTMVSSHQSHTLDQWPLYLSIQHHGLFSPIPYITQSTLMYGIGEKRPWCCIER